MGHPHYSLNKPGLSVAEPMPHSTQFLCAVQEPTTIRRCKPPSKRRMHLISDLPF
jgi:hypothetical protein